jgi:hypothetical protein
VLNFPFVQFSIWGFICFVRWENCSFFLLSFERTFCRLFDWFCSLFPTMVEWTLCFAGNSKLFFTSSMKIIFLVKIIELFCFVFLGSINWNFLNFFYLKIFQFVPRLQIFIHECFPSGFHSSRINDHPNITKHLSFHNFHGNKNSCNFFRF